MIIFDINDPFGKVLKRLRLGFGKFREHKFRQGFKDTLNSLCSCGIEAETTAQYFLISHLYNSIRATFTVEAVAQRCSVKKVFLKILQNSQENTCARVSFRVAGLMPGTLLKKRLWQRFFSVNFAKILRTPFLTE